MNKCETRNCNRITENVYCDQCFSESDAYSKGILRGKLDTLKLLESEFAAIQELGETEEYTQGFEHSILLLKDRMGLTDD